MGKGTLTRTRLFLKKKFLLHIGLMIFSALPFNQGSRTKRKIRRAGGGGRVGAKRVAMRKVDDSTERMSEPFGG